MPHKGSITPAYGRDYTDEDAAVADWQAGKDFIYRNITSPWDGKPCSKGDFSTDDTLQLRFDREREVAVVRGDAK